jgi:hypothetical protein
VGAGVAGGQGTRLAHEEQRVSLPASAVRAHPFIGASLSLSLSLALALVLRSTYPRLLRSSAHVAPSLILLSLIGTGSVHLYVI